MVVSPQSENLTTSVDGSGMCEDKIGSARDQAVQVVHAGLTTPEKGGVAGHADHLIGLIHPECFTETGAQQCAEALHAGIDRPQKGFHSFRALRGSRHMSRIVDGDRFARGIARQRAEILHAGALRPKKGMGSQRTVRTACDRAPVVDRKRLAVMSAR